MKRSYRKKNLRLARGCDPGAPVLQLQRDLRRLGYLESGLDGFFGPRTERAIKALEIDLLGDEPGAPHPADSVSVAGYNRSRVTAADGVLDQALAACISDMLADEDFCKVPESANPVDQNAGLMDSLAPLAAGVVPRPFLCAILQQESGGRHFHEPSGEDTDNFLVVGLDRGTPGSPRITSRGYGVAQVTLFHHPPTTEEVTTLLADPVGNLREGVRLLREKFDKFVNGVTSATRADDRQAEIGSGPLRLCRYQPADPRYMTACRDCVARAGTAPGTDAPQRSNTGCDWPYAVRRYNGSGPRSYEYQSKILVRVLNS